MSPTAPCNAPLAIRPMILGALSLLTPRAERPIRPDEIASVDRDGARALNYALSRGIRRARRRVAFQARTLAMLAFGGIILMWSPVGLLAWVVSSAALSVLLDGMRYAMAAKWVVHTHGREFRAEEILVTGAALERGLAQRPGSRWRPQVVLTLAVAGACVLLGLPALWLAFGSLGWVSWGQVFANTFMPLFMIFAFGGRTLLAWQSIVQARAATVGSRELFLDSDDTLDAFALTLLLAPLLLLGGPAGHAVAYLVVLLRMAWWGWRWWSLRQMAALVARRVYRTNPNAPASRSTEWVDEDEDTGARRS